MRLLSKADTHDKDHTNFLPKALQLVDTPANPLASYLLIVIILFFITTLLWIGLSQIDIIAQAQGTVIPTERVRSIKAIKSHQIKKLFVTEGQKVKKGTTLLEWRNEEAITNLQQVSEKIKALNQYIEAKKQLLLWVNRGGSLEEQQGNTAKNTWAYHAYSAWLAEQQMLNNKKIALVTQSRAQQFYLKSLQAQKELGQQQLASAKKLLDNAYISNNNWQTLQSRLIELNYQIQSKQLEHQSFTQQITQIDQQMQSQKAQKKSALLEEIYQLETQLQQLNSEYQRYSAIDRNHIVKAPITGVVKDLTVYGEMAVVGAGETIMKIVPITNKLEIEAYLANQDIGFVKKGDEVKIKVSAFPFSRFGTLTGTVVNKNNDTTFTGQKSLGYRLNIALQKNHLIDAAGNILPLSSGMEVMAEIKTGHRSLLSYLLSPIKQQLGRAMQER